MFVRANKWPRRLIAFIPFFCLNIYAVQDILIGNISGKWNGVLKVGRDRIPVILKLNKGIEPSGTVALGEETKQLPIENATLHGQELYFEANDSAVGVVTFRLYFKGGIFGGKANIGGRVSKVTLAWADAAHPVRTVTLKVLIERDGTVRRVKVIRSVNPDLDKKAVDAVMKWKFTPAQAAKGPIAVKAMIEVNFREGQ